MIETITEPPDWARRRAERKLALIIERYGDDGGERLKPGYLAQLIAETIRADNLSLELQQGQKKTARAKAQGHPNHPYCSTGNSEMQ